MKYLPKLKRILTILSIIIIFFLALILLGDLVFTANYPYPAKINYGVTFSPKFATYLGLDWKEIYIKILGELEVKHIRIPTYWDVLEPESGKYDFSQVDFMLDQAKIRNVKVILTLGARQPRWPECHIPEWAKQMPLILRQQKLLEFIGRTVERYKVNTAILAWQVENEPLLSSFGEGCDPPDEDFLKQEVELVRILNSKPIILTDSGELGLWIVPMKFSDIFGTTLYRQVYDQTFGYITYPYPSYFYNLKSTVIRAIFAKNNQKTIISELQAEPWLAKNGQSLFSVDDFKKYVNYARQTGFDTIYLWGVEWWYFMESKGYPQYLEYAKSLF